ncbi:hypothetical protein K2173_023318 [Erythroxylum novogranatense]|uniref:C3H1-type domain-containing protein n=1 Tax=Erythroxylum novogranatense TaxID=1862640 RepID=A0AAV8TA65_9ROSI|nr:hypothetical protein K2173_023318 [Erythroxylum novogranatense]
MDYSLHNNSGKFPRFKSLNVLVPPHIRYLRGDDGGGLSSFSSSGSPAMSNKSAGSTAGHRKSLLSPLSAVENVTSPVLKYGTPLEEDVLVMDELASADGGHGGGGGGGVRVLRSLLSNSGGSSSSSTPSSSSSAHSAFKTELCRSWEDFGRCRFGYKCQFAHGKEELRPTHFPIKKKTEVHGCKSSLYGLKCQFHQMTVKEAAATTSQKASSEFSGTGLAFTCKCESSTKNDTPTRITPHSDRTPILFKPERNKSSLPNLESEDFGMLLADITAVNNWTPFDDGIEIILPSQVVLFPSREDVDAHIDDVLYGPILKKRLPVFTEICPE